MARVFTPKVAPPFQPAGVSGRLADELVQVVLVLARRAERLGTWGNRGRPTLTIEFDGPGVMGLCQGDPAIGYKLCRRFVAVVVETRRLMDVYNAL